MAEIEPWWKNPMLTSLEQILQDKAPGRIVVEVDCSSYVVGKWLAHLVAEGMS
jgi:hypothetical protein